MAAPKLSFIPYLQSWAPDTRTLSLRVLVAPTGNPLKPLLHPPGNLPAFADAALSLRAFVSDDVKALPMRTNVDQTADTPRRAAPQSRAIFSAIQAALDIPDGAAGDTFAPQAPDGTRQLRKYLPKSYRQSFDFVQPRTSLAVTDHSYHCLMQCPPADLPPPPPTVIGWGEAIAFSLRRPRLAEALGLIIPMQITLDPAPRLTRGGWLWVELAPDSDYAAETALPGFQRAFATRIPALSDAETRPLFTPVVFPVSDDATAAAALGQTDRVFTEAIRFDDGFAKIVHARQPLGVDMLDEEGTGPGAPRDEGVQLAWDDEDILEGQNRALGAAPDGQNNVVAPRGILGYRIDMRPAGRDDWISLSRVRSPVDIGVDLGTAIEERWLEVHPNEVEDQLWLPPWFAIWRGGSIVMETAEEQRLMNTAPPAAGVADPDQPVDLTGAELRYGQRYEFRVRLADATGGGPGLDATSLRMGEAPVALLHMRRHVPPRAPQIAAAPPPADGAVPRMRITRPPLGYPAAVFAAGPAAQSSLLAQIAANDADPARATPPAIPDPDTPVLRIRVLLRLPTYDPAADAQGWVEWFTTTRPFPTDPSQGLELDFDWRTAADYRDIDISSQLGAEGLVTGPLPLPRARDIRLDCAAIGRNDLSYFASDKARHGDSATFDLHALSATEQDPLARISEQDRLRSIFLRPDPLGARAKTGATTAQNDPSTVLVDRLAIAADLVADDAMLLAREGERVAFGCAGLTHHAAPDFSSLEFTEPGELAGQWINVAQLVIDRDWTWRGQGAPTVHVRRRLSLPDAPGDAPRWVDVGTIQLVNTINVQARRNPERGYVRLVFLDAFTPPLGRDGLPYEATVDYEMRLSFAGGDRAVQTASNRLPVVTPPRQVPKVCAAGIALTPYRAAEDYASTAPRQRQLWLEFDEPLADPRDCYFIRALYRTPDPMLLPDWEPARDPEVLETIPLDPELCRVITPGQVQDLSGLNAMQRLEPAGNSDRHFLVPLPPNTDPNSPALFSFFTCELRVGHGPGPSDDPFWSTAQGRFGEALLLEGLQHPAPELVCAVLSGPGRALIVQAPYATPYLGLKQVTPHRPNTQIWFVLYARLLQADGASWRNIQIGLQLGRKARRGPTAPLAPLAEAHWTEGQITDALRQAGLDDDTPLTVLAVETLPEPNGSFADPLGGDLGEVRVLRTSPLAGVTEDCCITR